MADEYVTTGIAARMLGISTRTVCKLADNRLIRSWLVPGSKHRRVNLADVRAVIAEGMGEKGADGG